MLRSWIVFTIAVIGLLISQGSFAKDKEDADHWIDVEIGKSTVLEVPADARAIAVTDPNIAGLQQLTSSGQQFQIQGLKVGSTDLIVQLGGGAAPIRYEITVHRNLADLIRRVHALTDDRRVRVYSLNDRIVVDGTVADLDTLEQVASVASIYDKDFINLMAVDGEHQVQLEVTFAEVSRSALRELGLNLMWGDSSLGIGMKGPTSSLGNSVTLSKLSNVIDGGVVPAAAAGTFNVMSIIKSANLGIVLSALDSQSLTRILARPTLACMSGQQCEFLAGGEIPVPSPSEMGSISIEYKQYGVKLSFIPTVLGGNLVDLQLQVEVSEPDYSNSVSITGISVPGFTSRKASSHLRLQSGLTFAMAGLLSESTSLIRSEVPGLGRIPIIGALFRYTKHVQEETELMIFVTPKLARPLGPDELPSGNFLHEAHNPNDLELFFLGLDRHGGKLFSSPTGKIGLER